MNTGRFVQCIRRVRNPVDQLIMQPVDQQQVNTSIRTSDVAIVTWLFPINALQRVMHRRYEAEAFHEMREQHQDAPTQTSSGGGVESGASSSEHHNNTATASGPTATTTTTKLGMATLIVGRNYPAKQTRLEKWLDPAPHPTLSLRISVMDRVHWQRTSWLAGSICKSLCWGRIPQAIFNIELDWKNEVVLDTEFDKDQNLFRKYDVSVPGLGFSLSLADTGSTLFDRQSKIVEGFLDNESALRQLGLAREVNMTGLGGSVYRQTLWSSPSMPNVATVTNLVPGTLFQRYFGEGIEPITLNNGQPVQAWLVDEVQETLIFGMEGHVEDENDPNSATTFGERSLVERVQKKAMNRYSDFRDDVRGKTYSDLDGRELPR